MSKPISAPMNAMVLAAGMGKRMRAATTDPPKPLTQIGGQSLLNHMLARLCAFGVTRIVINVHHKAAQIEAHLRRSSWPAEIVFSDERGQLLETGGGVKNALPLLGDAPFFVCNADILWQEKQAALSHLAASYDRDARPVHLLLARRSTTIGYDGLGDFVTNKPSSKEPYYLTRRHLPDDEVDSYVFAGVQIMSADWFAGIADKVFSLNQIYDAAIARGQLTGCILDGTWMHVGTPEGRAAAQALFD